MTVEEWDLIRESFEKIATQIAQEAKEAGFEKESYWAGIALSHYCETKVGGNRYVIVPTRLFRDIIEKDLIEATSRFPENFGQRDTEKVMQALFETCSSLGDFENFKRFAGHENFCLIFDLQNLAQHKVLRIDLFRMARTDEFIGGLFHGLKHFSTKGIPLSTHPNGYEIYGPKAILYSAIDALYNQELQPGKWDYSWVSTSKLWGREIQFVFRLNEKQGAYFINSVHVK
jgi:hypothetical protein